LGYVHRWVRGFFFGLVAKPDIAYHTIAPIIVLTTANIGGMVLVQATLTFIGMGGKSEWGELLARSMIVY
jgi:ABC-type dipeptide/oligopeptide/nickel transport system permease subunit